MKRIGRAGHSALPAASARASPLAKSRDNEQTKVRRLRIMPNRLLRFARRILEDEPERSSLLDFQNDAAAWLLAEFDGSVS